MNLYRFCWWLAYVFAASLFRVRVEGRRNIPLKNGVILASNHCSYVDPVIIGVAAGRELWYLAKAELFPIPLLGRLIHNLNAMPVDRRRGDRGALLAWSQLLKAGHPVLIFPEGTRNKSSRFIKPRSGVGMLVYRAQVPVVPVYISGSVNVWKTMIGLDRITVRFGEPIFFAPADLPERRKDAYEFISSEVMHHIAMLKRRRKAGTVAPASSAQQTA